MSSTQTLHIVNGDCTLHQLQQSGLPGAMFSGDDILMEGPTPNGLHDDADWKLRAEYLETYFGIPQDEYLTRYEERSRLLLHSLNYDEVVLWFEEDLFCQINLLFLLDWFSRQTLDGTKLSLVCPAQERLGMLSPQRLAELFETREAVTPEKLQFARAAWAAYCAPEPVAIEEFLQCDFDEWLMLKTGLQNHLRRFPSTRNGLNYIEKAILEQLGTTPLPFPQPFARVTESPAISQLGMGDVQVAAYLAELSVGAEPLVILDSFEDLSILEASGGNTDQWHGTLTDAGREVLAGKRDWLQLKPLYRWFGGTHLTPENMWRWDEEEGKLRRG